MAQQVRGKPIGDVPRILIRPRNGNVHPHTLSWSITQGVTYTHVPSLETMMCTWNINYFVQEKTHPANPGRATSPALRAHRLWVKWDWHNPGKILSRQGQQKPRHHERLNEAGSWPAVSWKKKKNPKQKTFLHSQKEEKRGKKKKEKRRKKLLKGRKKKIVLEREVAFHR